MAKRKTTKRLKLPGEPAWAWKCDFGLCCWAEPTRDALLSGCTKPSDEAKPVRVRIVGVAELKKLLGEGHGKDS